MGLFSKKEIEFEAEKDFDTLRKDGVAIPSGNVVAWKTIFNPLHMNTPGISTSMFASDVEAYSSEFCTDPVSYNKIYLFGEDDFKKNFFKDNKYNYVPELIELYYLDKDTAIKSANDKFDESNRNLYNGFMYHSILSFDVDQKHFLKSQVIKESKTILSARPVSMLSDSKFITVNDLRSIVANLLIQAKLIRKQTIDAESNKFDLIHLNDCKNLFTNDNILNSLYDASFNKLTINLVDFNIMINRFDTDYQSILSLINCKKELNNMIKADKKLREDVENAFGVKVGN